MWCPDWPVTAVGTDPAAPATPVAVVTEGRVAACSAAARAGGVRRGQRLRDAQRHCPDLVVRHRDLDTEGRLFEDVVAAVTTLTPWVEVLRPGLCAIPVRGPLRQAGDERRLRGQVGDAVAAAGFACGVGIADGVFAAVLAARAGPSGTLVPAGQTPRFLATHPVTALDRPELADLLYRLGVSTLGDFAALPPGAVAQRFGADGAAAHRLARGLDARPPVPRPPRTELAVRHTFEPAAERADRVVAEARPLAERLHRALAAEGLACVRVAVEVTWTDGRTLRRLWRHEGMLSDRAVAERVGWQLAHATPAGGPGGDEVVGASPARTSSVGAISAGATPVDTTPTGAASAGDNAAGKKVERPSSAGATRVGEGASGTTPVNGAAVRAASTDAASTDAASTGDNAATNMDADAVGDGVGGVAVLRLVPDHLVPATGRQETLWGRPTMSGRVSRAVARVQDLLGHRAVTRVLLGGGRAPADRVVRVPATDRPDPPDRSAPQGPWPGQLPPPAPTVVPPDPLPASVTDTTGAPVTVSGRGAVSAPPAQLSVAGGTALEVVAWTGPWPATERWWDPARRRRRARFQVHTAYRGYLLAVEKGRWYVEALYD